MRTVVSGGTVVPGDGSEPSDAAVVISAGRIEAVEPVWPSDATADRVIDASGCLVLPGLINCHTHGVTPGPLFPSAAEPLPEDEWLSNLDRHLLAGTTTVLNLCGFATMADVRAADRAHAVKVRGATTYLPAALRAARAADGAGLPNAECTVEAMLTDGAVAIGELGGGQTMGGGGQDLHYIPRVIERETGRMISPAQARRLKDAVLGPHLDPADLDAAALDSALTEAGLALTPAHAAKLVCDSVLPSLRPAMDGLREGARAAAKYGVPALVHSAAASVRTLRELATAGPGEGACVIATHSNHPSFEPDEAEAAARKFRAVGWQLECCTFDLLDGRHTVTTREHWDRLLADPDLVTILATDYGWRGRHDPLIAGVHDVVARGYRSLGAAVAMVSGNVARAIPGLAPGAGRLARGRPADVVIARADDMRDVRHVLVDGNHVVRDGALTAAARR